jgi:hypothetical protein
LWIERDAQGLRARVIEVDDLAAGAEVSRGASRLEEISAVVSAFVERFVGDDGVTGP